MSPIEYGVNYFISFFQNPSAWGIGLAIAFGAVWLACYWPPLFKKPWLWAVLVSSAFLTLAAVSFIQIPLFEWIHNQLYTHYSPSYIVLGRLFYLAGMPLIIGLITEGAKLVPVVVWWRRSGRNLDPKLGLTIGAVAGAGFGILEARWILGLGTHWGVLPPLTQYVFLWIFFPVAAQIAFSALSGYGLAKGWGWQFYLIASVLHGLLNLALKLFPAGLFIPEVPSELRFSLGALIYTAVLAAAVTAWALWLRWRKTATAAEPEISSP